MNYIDIIDINCPELNIYHQFRDKAYAADNSFVADSPKVVNLLLETDITVKSILATREYYNEYEHLVLNKNIPKLYVATKKQMQEIVGHKLHHNVMMHAIRPEETPLNKFDNHIIMLDEISSTENIGSIARSAAAIGINSYLLPLQGPNPYSRRSVRVSMGHIGMMNYHLYKDIFETIKELKTLGYKIYAAEVTENSTVLSKVDPANKWVLLMGHEGKGIAKEILNVCDEVITIEMEEGIKSFNVSVAASIIMYQFNQKINTNT